MTNPLANPDVILTERPEYHAYDAWVRTLKDGDEVAVYQWAPVRFIHRTTVRVTKTGRVHLNGSYDRQDWRRWVCMDCPGGGQRFIAPLDGRWAT